MTTETLPSGLSLDNPLHSQLWADLHRNNGIKRILQKFKVDKPNIRRDTFQKMQRAIQGEDLGRSFLEAIDPALVLDPELLMKWDFLENSVTQVLGEEGIRIFHQLGPRELVTRHYLFKDLDQASPQDRRYRHLRTRSRDESIFDLRRGSLFQFPDVLALNHEDRSWNIRGQYMIMSRESTSALEDRTDIVDASINDNLGRKVFNHVLTDILRDPVYIDSGEVLKLGLMVMDTLPDLSSARESYQFSNILSLGIDQPRRWTYALLQEIADYERKYGTY